MDSTLPKEQLTYVEDDVTILNETQSVVSCMYEGSHFATMKVGLLKKEVVIFDGLVGNAKDVITKWSMHVKYVLKRCGLSTCKYIESIRLCNATDFGGQLLKQNDSYNCGPIACVVA